MKSKFSLIHPSEQLDVITSEITVIVKRFSPQPEPKKGPGNEFTISFTSLSLALLPPPL